VASDLPGGAAGWLPAWLAIAAISLADDARDVPVLARLSVQAACALWSAAWLLRASVGALPGVAPGEGYLVAVVLIALAIAWSMNLYNFMDGSDGLAGATTLIGFGAMAAAAGGDEPLRLACVAIAGACIPFLAVNRPPARMFMGDVGSVPAGFLAAMFGIGGALRGDWPAWFPVLVFLPFLADATVTLMRRALRGERVWEAHRSHYYQRLHQLGAGHAGTLALYAAVTAASAASALLLRAHAPQLGIVALAAWIAVVVILFAAIDYHWRRKPSATR
jgi:UDP-N-acetylmuramyl pentapeptide phosphotransferase/UDP-N-acetylglucosamine-1-phosphate transferase